MAEFSEKAPLSIRPSVDASTQPISTTTTLGNDFDTANPVSPFYSHPTTRQSLEKAASESRTRLDFYDQDLESQPASIPAAASSTTHLPKPSMDARPKDCTVWPTQRTLKQKAKIAKRERACNPLLGLNKRQRWGVKVLIILLVLAAAVGVGVGISRAVGGGIWAGNGKTKDIP
ncbi:hypothetical protein P152DRAFT_199891 [Eremomyces bilateralis CBS 781.70]|uniref:Uncharacterized protein n=1 Tax=Eremomyces bilateralis CBS 781.70 TaxID=1392243 RepID=A0A6G1GCX7_9PEZI|nr:uncharacterized protein P152DRAFT_199891 [Eremomyces bilateralis CBS 781.70]KAF1815862.1 hypothetical protein P152DRAFT_199891 [Eremomyces bilateralis CBS 781.70]